MKPKRPNTFREVLDEITEGSRYATPSPPFLYTLTRNLETTHQALCSDHAPARLEALEDDGFELRQSVSAAGQPCVVCREYAEQARAERNAGTA